LPDGLFLPGAEGVLSFAALPPTTTAEVEELTVKVARRLAEVLSRAQEEGSEQRVLDPDLTALYEALAAAVHAPIASRASALAGVRGRHCRGRRRARDSRELQFSGRTGSEARWKDDNGEWSATMSGPHPKLTRLVSPRKDSRYANPN
jgi:hypothetical protein